jgi:hypothetical protein
VNTFFKLKKIRYFVYNSIKKQIQQKNYKMSNL